MCVCVLCARIDTIHLWCVGVYSVIYSCGWIELCPLLALLAHLNCVCLGYSNVLCV